MEVFGLVLLIIVLFVFIGLYLYLTWNFNYFEKYGIKTDAPLPFVGNMYTRYFKMHLYEAERDGYKRLGKVHGIYEGRNPVLFVGELDLVKQLLVKHFNYFTDRRFLPFTNSTKSNVALRFLSLLKGDDWRTTRNALSPAFTSGKLKQMGELIEVSSERVMKEHVETEIGSRNSADVDMRKVFGLHTIDVVVSCVFGVTLKSLSTEDPLYIYGSNILGREITLKTFLMLAYPNLAKFLSFDVLTLDTVKYFENIAHNVIEQRRKNKVSRPNFLQLLLAAQDKESEELKENAQKINGKSENKQKVLDESTIIAQAMLFLFTGVDTVGSTLSYVIYLLALYPECQEKLYNELEKLNGKFNCETALQCEYLDMVISETLRMYPVAARLERTCTADCTVGDIPIKKGMNVTIPVYAIHYDEDNYSDPNTFNPERFSPENKSSINPYAYLPFGVGPRNCIAMRFALIQCKIAIARFVHKYKFSACSETEIPISFTKSLSMLVPKNKVMITVERRI